MHVNIVHHSVYCYTSQCSSGGVVLASRDGKIVCENTLDARLQVVFRKKLPEVSCNFSCFLDIMISETILFNLPCIFPHILVWWQPFFGICLFTDPSKSFCSGSCVTNSWKRNVAQYSFGYPDYVQKRNAAQEWFITLFWISIIMCVYFFSGYGCSVIRFQTSESCTEANKSK